MLLALLAWALSIGSSNEPSSPQYRPIPQAQVCYGIHQRTGFRVPVRHVLGESGGFVAYARADEYGYPTIYYSSAYFELTGTMQRFTAHHECGHHELGTSNEIASNCYALDAMNPTNAELRHIGDTFRSFSTLGPQYGGSGRAFWESTLMACGY